MHRATSDLRKFRAFLKTSMPGPHAYVVLLGLSRFDWAGVIERIERGLPYSSLERLQKNTGFTTEQMIDLLQVPKRTLARRKAAGKLSPEESDRLVRLARVYAKALHLFNGDPESTTAWLVHSQRAFDGVPPIEMIRTDVGAQEVETLVGQLEHGVFP
jgi:putative toxin-antitoxin system antitoxin component (TIGR02293 family)